MLPAYLVDARLLAAISNMTSYAISINVYDR